MIVEWDLFNKKLSHSVCNKPLTLKFDLKYI